MGRTTSLLSLGIVPSATGFNVNPIVRRAVVAKLAQHGVTVSMRTGVPRLCDEVARITGLPVPASNDAHGWLAQWVVASRSGLAAPVDALGWKDRPALRMTGLMAVNARRATGEQGRLITLGGMPAAPGAVGVLTDGGA